MLQHLPAPVGLPSLPSPEEIELFVRALDGSTLSLQLLETAAIGALQSAVEKRTGVPVKEQRLTFGVKPFRGDDVLRALGIGNGSELELT